MPLRILRRFRRLGPPLRRQRGRIAVGMLCLPAHAVTVLALPYLIGSLLDRLTGNADDGWLPQTLGSACLVLAGLAILEGLLRYISRRAIIDASRYVEQELKDSLAAHLLKLPIPWFDRARTGDLVSRMTQDVELLRFLIGPVILHGGSALVILPGGLLWMFLASPGVTFACLGAFALMLVGLRVFTPRIHRAGQRVQKDIGDISQRIQEDFAGIRTVQAFGAGATETAALSRVNRRYLVHNLELTRLRAWVNVLLHAVSNFVVLGVLVVGGLSVIDGTLTAGDLVRFLMYVGLMMWPLQAIGWSIGTIPRALAAADRIEEILGTEPETCDGAALDGPGRLEVRGLTFRYPDQDRPALANVSFDLEPGASLGLVGPVGCGKSTLLAVLLRLYDPPRGTVFVDGVDILDLDPRALRERFAFAPQDPFLFSDSLRRNVALGGAATGVRDAVNAAALQTDLELLPDGLDTVVGERGVTLSGGQKQRVSLARALAADRPGLILDDTLSAVDVGTERSILAGLEDAAPRTLLVASHRLSAVRSCDHILVLEDGRVTAMGRHEELLHSSRVYAHAWRLQTEAGMLEGER